MSRSASSIGGKTKHKLVFLGDQGTGKSSIIERFINNRYADESNPTIGIDFLAKNFIHGNRTYRLQLWDTAGQERFKSLIPGYLKDAVCAIFVYDCTNMESLHNIDKWIALYRENKPDKAVCVICSNKIDLRDSKTDVEKEGEQYAHKLGFPHFGVSAKSGEHINDLFAGVIDTIVSGSHDDEKEKNKNSKIQSFQPILQKEPPANPYDFAHVPATSTRTSRNQTANKTIKLNPISPEDLEEDRKLLEEGRGGCCRL